MFCHKCGTQIAEGADFCHKCGTKVVYEHFDPPTTDSGAHDTTNAKVPIINKSAKLIGAILVGIVILVFIITGGLQNLKDTFTAFDQAVEAGATDSTVVPGTQSASDLFRDTETASNNNSAESSFAWVEEARMVTEGDLFKTRYIVGAIENISDTTFVSASVQFILYDSAGNQIDTTLDVISNFKAGNTWRFKALVSSDDVAYFEFLQATKTYPKQ